MKKPNQPSRREGDSAPKPESGPRQLGRRLILRFIHERKPELDRIEFRSQASTPPRYWQRGDSRDKGEHSFSWTRVPQSLALVFLDYLCKVGPDLTVPVFFSGSRTGSFAASLGEAISQPSNRLHELLAEASGSGTLSRAKQVFSGVNVHGKDDQAERRIWVQSEYLPPDCIEVYWGLAGSTPVTDRKVLERLLDRLRKSLGVTEDKPEVPDPATTPPPSPAPVPAPEPVRDEPVRPSVESTPEDEPNFPELRDRRDWIAGAMKDGGTPEDIYLWLKGKGVVTTPTRVESFCRALALATGLSKPPLESLPRQGTLFPDAAVEPKPGSAPRSSPTSQPPGQSSPAASASPPATASPNIVFTYIPPISAGGGPQSQAYTKGLVVDHGSAASSPQPASDEPTEPPGPTIPPVHPALFLVYSNGESWDNDDPLLAFAEQEEPWRLKDSFEGLSILGGVGSGKTSGSGAAFADVFLRAGFGGLVLCAKPGEGQRWQRLCHRCGRGGDVILVGRDGPPLNILAYESQRPGGDLALAENLVSLFRVLLDAAARGGKRESNDSFWRDATNQLMRSLFEAFVLAGEPLSVDRLNRFLARAPQAPLKDPAKGWQRIPLFGDILSRAGEVQTERERRVYHHILDYWTRVYPGLADRTRSSIALGWSAMADVLSSRGIHELLCGDTLATPELALAGHILILDLPLKVHGQGGLLVQSAWKHLFQRTVERRAVADSDTHRYPMFHLDKQQAIQPTPVVPGTGDRRRPVFLWEDEAQFFFSPHDVDFQATCREARVAHVILSQHLPNFYQLGHNKHAVDGLFSSINTQIFHSNSDVTTNKWASERIGKHYKTRFQISTKPVPRPKGFWDYFKDPETGTSTSTTGKWEELVRPEDFSSLKKAGDGTCEAIVLWLSHAFTCNRGLPFHRMVFNQEPLA